MIIKYVDLPVPMGDWTTVIFFINWPSILKAIP